jgi:hypothetical protein
MREVFSAQGKTVMRRRKAVRGPRAGFYRKKKRLVADRTEDLGRRSGGVGMELRGQSTGLDIPMDKLWKGRESHLRHFLPSTT